MTSTSPDRQTGPTARRAGIAAALGSAASTALIAAVAAYQVALRPLLIGSCKFCPTCSDYFIEAVRKHGPLRGSWLGVRRLLRCTPLGRGGYDPVP